MLRTTWALTASVVFSCLLALLLEQSDKILRSVRQVERHLGLPCLALVPTVPRAKRRFGLHRSLLGSPSSAYAQSLPTLATQVATSRARSAVVLVTSSLPEAGKFSPAGSLAFCRATTPATLGVLVAFGVVRTQLTTTATL